MFDNSSYVELSNDCLFNEIANSSLVSLNNATQIKLQLVSRNKY